MLKNIVQNRETKSVLAVNTNLHSTCTNSILFTLCGLFAALSYICVLTMQQFNQTFKFVARV